MKPMFDSNGRIGRAGWIIILCLALPLPSAFSQSASWLSEAKAFAAAHPTNKGLPHLIEALGQIDFQSIAPHDAKLKAIAADGWTQQYPEIQQLLQSKSSALVAAVKAADATPFDLPPQTSVESPVVDFLAVTTTIRLLVCEARRLEAAGDLANASVRAVQAARFSSIFAAKDQLLIGHLISLSGLGAAFPALESIMRNPRTSPETLKFIGAALYEIEQKRTPSAAAYELEKKITLASLDGFDALTKSNPEMARMMAPYLQHKAEYERVMDAIIENEAKPYWQRRSVRQLIPSDLKFELPNSDESSTRETVVIAKLRLIQAMCAERLEMKEAAAQYIDPFTGQPFKIMPQLIYSLGPDRADQNGAVIYDPVNGAISPGDIVLKRSK